MKATLHDVIVKVDKAINDEIEMGKTKLYLNGEYDIYKNTKIVAEVVSVPPRLKGVVLYGKMEGIPPYHGKKDAEGKYYPTPHLHKYVTMEETEVEVQEGDTVYFHYLTLSKSNYLGRDEEGLELYKCGYEQIFCFVREGKIRMVNGWITVKALQDESYEEVEVPILDINQKEIGEQTIRVKQTESGIIYDTNDDAVFRQGTVVNISEPPDNKEYGILPLDVIIYSDFSEFTNTIEGEEYFLMKLWDVVAVIRDKKIIPVGDYVMMDASDNVIKTTLIIPDKYKRKPDTANIIALGNFVEGIQPRDKVQYSSKEAYYVPVDDVKLCFIRYQNIMLILEA